MCLFTNLGKACTAEKDITCYKLVYPGDRWNMPVNVFKGMVMDFQYKVGETYDEPLFHSTPIFDKKGTGGDVYKGFHSYRTLSEAVSWAIKRCIILKCVIPKGSRYYYSSDKTCYCSDKIRIEAWRQTGLRPLVWNTKQRTKEDAIKALNMCN